MITTFTNFAEELQAYISANSGLGLNHDPDSGNVNFTLGNFLNVIDLSDELGSNIDLTIYEEGGNVLLGARKDRQERTIRFLYKGSSGQGAVNLCWALLGWLWNNARSFQTTSFRIWIPRPADKFPSTVAANQDGTYLADFVTTFYVYGLTS